MAKLTDDADYDADETFENVPSPLSYVANHDNYYGRRLRTRCVLLSNPDNNTKLIIATGDLWNAGTTAQINVILYGEFGDTGPRALCRPVMAETSPFAKGQVGWHATLSRFLFNI
ncbi:unnamed protein product [Protopolystoma xenopodis]|uniref:PLAT domain-containing protein n=1 Tax=Protopolystoma xenopodis TaxID=117903 RepID=A0A3S5A2V6_9PLAT|nr:unnamed protein product [Protopolystoma xenopodis]